MRVYENQRVATWAISTMREKMGQSRTGEFHASELFQCARKSILSRQHPPEYDEESILNFAVGYATQSWFLGEEEASVVSLGISYTPDAVVEDNVIEFKSTRRSYESLPKDPKTGKGIKGAEKIKFQPDQHWVDRTVAYLAMKGLPRAHILVYFIFQLKLAAWTIEVTSEEREQALADILRKRDLLEAHTQSGTLPPPVPLYGWE